MSDQFLITTARLGFRWWTADDAPLAHLLWGDPEVMRYMGGPHSVGSAEERLKLQLELADSRQIQYWPMFVLPVGAEQCTAQNGQDPTGGSGPSTARPLLKDFVGCCGLKVPPERYGPDVLETGFHLRPQFWRQGYGEEAARAVLAYAFGTLGVAAVFAGRHPENIASGNLLTKLGFQPDGYEFFPRTGLMHPAYLLSASDWAAQTGG